MKSSLFSSDGRIVEKNDQTPVTVADFGVQALVSLGSYLKMLIAYNFFYLHILIINLKFVNDTLYENTINVFFFGCPCMNFVVICMD